eukprot:6213453-Pleurochrysis_carterae.AAC.12
MITTHIYYVLIRSRSVQCIPVHGVGAAAVLAAVSGKQRHRQRLRRVPYKKRTSPSHIRISDDNNQQHLSEFIKAPLPPSAGVVFNYCAAFTRAASEQCAQAAKKSHERRLQGYMQQ